MQWKVAIIGTTRNCRDEMEPALQTFTTEQNLALLNEIVIVDGGSTDGTWELLQQWAARVPKLRVYSVPGANISRGRNEAIQRTDADIIVTFDSGTRYCDDWLKWMLEPFEHQGADVVGGKTHLVGKTLFESCMAGFREPTKDAIQPSHRGCAYKREVWERIGGYPEHVEAGEDTWFNTQWHALGYTYVHAPQAEQYWRVRSSWKGIFRMNRRNTRGHIRLREPWGIWTITAITALHILLPVLFVWGFLQPVAWLIAVILYGLNLAKRMLQKGRWREFMNPVRIVVGAYALLACDLGMTIGTLEGLIALVKDKMPKVRGSSNDI